MHACRDSFLLAVAENERCGLGKRDISHNINFFMNVPVTPDGGLHLRRRRLGAGQVRRDARARWTSSSLISNCPQLNNPCNAYNPTPIEVLIWDAEAPDACSARSSSPIAARSPAASSARSPHGRRQRRGLLGGRPARAACRRRPTKPSRSARRPPRRAISSVDAILDAARATGAQAIHPGYGFLSRERGLRRSVRASAGIVFIGPRPEQMRALRPEARGARACAERGRAAAARNRVCSRDVGRRRERSGAHRLSGDAQEHGGRRRHRHAAASRRRASSRRMFERVRAPRAQQLQGRRRLPREVRRARRGTSRCRSSATAAARRRARRARLLGAAPQPEGHRGDAGAGPAGADARGACGDRGARSARAVDYRSAGTVEFVYDAETRRRSTSSRSTRACRSSTASPKR